MLAVIMKEEDEEAIGVVKQETVEDVKEETSTSQLIQDLQADG